MSQLPPLLCSTGAFSRYPDYTYYRDVLEYGPQLEVEGFELMFYTSWYPEVKRIAADLKRSGLSFLAVHAEKGIGVGLGKAERAEREQAVQNFLLNCQLASTIEAPLLILHLWGWPELDDQLEYNLEMLGICLDTAARYGVEVALETIPCRRATPLQNIERALAQDNRCRVALDTEFLSLHQQLAEVFTHPDLWQGQHIRHTHIKDFSGSGLAVDGRRRYLHPGEGIIDFRSFFANLQQQNYTGNISLESPVLDSEGHVDLPKLHRSLDFLRDLISEIYR